MRFIGSPLDTARDPADNTRMSIQSKIAELRARAEDASGHIEAMACALQTAEDAREDGECMDSVQGSISDAEEELCYLEGACADLRELLGD